jgi:hypothetical protein
MKNELFILWTTDDPITSKSMALMYAHNAFKNSWWDEVTVIIWGASTKYVSEDSSIQNRLKKMSNDGVKISACKGCADELGVSEKIKDLGIELKYWGEPLTEIIKENRKLITI